MNFEEKTLSSQYVFNGNVIDVKRDEVQISTGRHSFREVVEHPGGVVIAAVENDTILMVKQYRYPLKKVSLELPAGKLERGEDPDLAAKRELEEETGYVAKNWRPFGYIYTSPGFCDEKLYLYLATELEYKKQNPDEDEIIEGIKYSLNDVYTLIHTGKINDSKTICAMFRAREYLK